MGKSSGGGDSSQDNLRRDVEAAIRDAEWLTKVRVRAMATLAGQTSLRRDDGSSLGDATRVLSGLIEDLQSAFDMTDDAFAMLALTYVLRRDPTSSTQGESSQMRDAISALAQAITEEQESASDPVELYSTGFIHGLAAAVKNIHMNA